MGICYDCKSIAVILNTQYLKMMIRNKHGFLLKMQSHIKSFHYKWKLFVLLLWQLFNVSSTHCNLRIRNDE